MNHLTITHHPRKFMEDLRNKKAWTFYDFVKSGMTISVLADNLKVIEDYTNEIMGDNKMLVVFDQPDFDRELKRHTENNNHEKGIQTDFLFYVFQKIVLFKGEGFKHNVLEHENENGTFYFALWTTKENEIEKIDEYYQEIKKKIEES